MTLDSPRVLVLDLVMAQLSSQIQALSNEVLRFNQALSNLAMNQNNTGIKLNRCLVMK